MNTAEAGSSLPVYQEAAAYDIWLKLLLGGIIAVLAVAALVLVFQDPWSALIMLGVTVFDALLFYGILPHRYEVWPDRLTVVLGGPFSFSLQFSNISTVRAAPGWKALEYPGIRFATSTRQVLEVTRTRGWNIVISPARADTFARELNTAIEQWRSSRPETT